jgi:hypothetical protein
MTTHHTEPQTESIKTYKTRLQLGLSPDEEDRAEAITVWRDKFADIVDYSAITPADCQRIFVSGYVRGLRAARNAAVAIVGLLLCASVLADPDTAQMVALQKEAMRRAEAERIHRSIEAERLRLLEIHNRPMPAPAIVGLPQVVPIKPIVITYPPKAGK